MQTFENQIGSRWLILAVIVPPAMFWTVFAWASEVWLRDGFALAPFLAVLFLAHALPLGALAWSVASVCACSLGDERFIVHRVIWDRVWPVAAVEDAIDAGNGIVRIRIANTWMTFRPSAPAEFLEALWGATRRAT